MTQAISAEAGKPGAPRLFTPITIRGLTVRNRVWLSPMCQYSVRTCDGAPTDWHLVHLGARAAGGFGLILTEATAVLPEGRISPQDTGIWAEEQVVPWRRITDFVHTQHAAIGIQLAHAGRKGSTYALESASTGTVPISEGGWSTVGPTAAALPGLSAPAAMTQADIARAVHAFGAAAARADRAGFDVVELHAGHGYLIHQFLSPLSNDREDSYGGTFENRCRFLTEIVEEVRRHWPADKPLFVRFSGSEWVDGGWDTKDSALVAQQLTPLGVDLVDVSSGGVGPGVRIATGPGYQVPFAREIRELSGAPTGAVGLITTAEQAEEILDAGAADVVLIGRAALRDPGWANRAAHELGLVRDQIPYPPQYLRAAWRHDRSANPKPKERT